MLHRGKSGLEKLALMRIMEGAQTLILTLKPQISELGKLTKEEWVKGLHMSKSWSPMLDNIH